MNKLFVLFLVSFLLFFSKFVPTLRYAIAYGMEIKQMRKSIDLESFALKILASKGAMELCFICFTIVHFDRMGYLALEH